MNNILPSKMDTINLNRAINLTPHTICIRAGGFTLELHPKGVARVAVGQSEVAFACLGFFEPASNTLCPVGPAGTEEPVFAPIVQTYYGAVVGLPGPDENPGACYLVSALVLQRCAGRLDVFAPDTGPTAIRDDSGRIVACTQLVAAPPLDVPVDPDCPF